MDKLKLSIRSKIFFAVLFSILGILLVVLASVFQNNLPKLVVYILNIFGALSLFVGISFIYTLIVKKDNKLTIKQMTLIAVQSAISVILYYFVKFNLPFFPPWLDIQVSEIPALITGFAYGPYAGSLVILVRFITKLPATITAGVGELADLILGITLVCISSIIYHRNKSIKTALIGLIVSISFATILACILNWLVLIPAYIYLANFPMEALVGMMNYIPGLEVTSSNFMLVYIFVGVLPFNIFRYIIVSILTFLLYKKTHVLLNHLSR